MAPVLSAEYLGDRLTQWFAVSGNLLMLAQAAKLACRLPDLAMPGRIPGRNGRNPFRRELEMQR